MKIKPKYALSITRNDGTTKSLYPTRKSKISRNPELKNFKSAYLKVHYTKKIYNDGDFSNKQDLLRALHSWTEPTLLRYVEEGEWQ